MRPVLYAVGIGAYGLILINGGERRIDARTGARGMVCEIRRAGAPWFAHWKLRSRLLPATS